MSDEQRPTYWVINKTDVVQTEFDMNFAPGATPMNDAEERYKGVLASEHWADVVDKAPEPPKPAVATETSATEVPAEELVVESMGPPVEDPEEKTEAVEVKPPRRRRGRKKAPRRNGKNNARKRKR